jgi:AcrR family transcriptional regulator
LPKIVDREAYRDELLDAALTIFAKRGYRATTMRSLAKDLGVSTGTVYHYVENKSDLFRQVVQRAAATLVAEALERLEHRAGADRLEVLFDFVHDRRHAWRALFLTALDAVREPGSVDAGVVTETLRGLQRVVADRLETSAGKARMVIEVLLGRLAHEVLTGDHKAAGVSLDVLRAALVE